MPLRSSARLLLALICASFSVTAIQGQTNRPAVCRVLSAQMRTVQDAPESETTKDTIRLQQALDICPAGEAVELSAAGDDRAFLTGPLLLPAGVTLWIDPGVTVFASRWRSEFGDPAKPLPLFRAATGSGLGGYGVIDGRAGTILLSKEQSIRTRWLDLPETARPALVEVDDRFDARGVTLRSAPGVAIAGSGKVSLEDIKLIGDLAGPGTTGLRLVGSESSAQVAGSAIVVSGQALDLAPEVTAEVRATAIYSGNVQGLPASAPCLMDSYPAFACVAAALPSLRAELVQSGSQEVAAILTVLDTRLPDAAGQVDLLEGDTVLATMPVISSSAIFDLGSLRAGIHHLHARFASAGLTFGDLTVTQGKTKAADVPATITLTSSATTFPYGTPLTLTAALNTANGVVTFMDGSVALGQALMSGGAGSLTISTLALGPHTVTAVYAGDTQNAPQTSPALTLQVNPVTTIVSFGPLPPSVPYGTVLTLVGTVLPVTATGPLVFRDGGQALGQTTLAGGSASLAVGTLPPGMHTLSAVYPGDSFDLPASSSTVSVNVTQLSTITTLFATPSTTTVGSSVQLNVGVSPNDASGAVTISDGSNIVARVTLASGTSSTQLTTLSPGLHSLLATYVGDSLHASSTSSSLTVEVDRVSTVTVLAPLPVTTTLGVATTLVASVTPPGASGVVTFTDRNSGALGQATLTSGTATLSAVMLATGPHSITASYAGDTNDAPSTSMSTTTTVPLSAATLVLSGVAASVPYSAPSVLSAIVTPSSASGSVALTDSASGPLGTMLLTGGSGSISLPALVPGPHVLLATYSGDPSFSPAKGSLSLNVTPDTTTTTLTAAQLAVPAGSPVLLNLRVSALYTHSPGGLVNVRVTSGSGTFAYSAALVQTLLGSGFATLALDSSQLGLGTFSATANYPGDAFDEASASAPTSFSVIPTPTSLLFTLPANPIAAGMASSMTATISAGSTTMPTGIFSFFRNGSLLGTLPVVNGTATMPLAGLAPGSYALTVSYAPTGLFGPSVSTAQVLVVTLPVSITLTPSSVSMKAGTDAISTLAITPLSGYAGTFAETCMSPSSWITCSVDSAAGPGTTTTAVRLHLATTTARQSTPPSMTGWLALLLPVTMLGRRRFRKTIRQTVIFIAASLLLAGSVACGAGNFFNVPPGNYGLTVSVTAAGSTVSAPLTVVAAN